MPTYSKKLAHILSSWEDTPYLEGSQAKGSDGGTDCVRFVCGVVDELYKYTRIIDIKLPSDAQFHSPEHCFAAMRQLKEAYDPLVNISFSALEPGDLLVSGPLHGGPGHLMIVGPEANTLWHMSMSVGTCKSGLYPPLRCRFFRAWRFEDRHKWLT